MNEEKPFPITMQPQFNYEPGGQEWFWVGILAILAITSVICLSRKKKSSKIRAYKILLKELEAVKRNSSSSVATRSSSIIKRALQLYFANQDFLALSASEVEDFLRTNAGKRGLSEIHELAKHLTELEHARFSGNALEGTGHVEAITQLIRDIMIQLQKEEKRRRQNSPVNAL